MGRFSEKEKLIFELELDMINRNKPGKVKEESGSGRDTTAKIHFLVELLRRWTREDGGHKETVTLIHVRDDGDLE